MTTDELNKKRGTRLKECRIEKNLTQSQLAEICYCTPQTISYIENGRRGMSRDLAHVFSIHLEVNEGYLLCEDCFKTYQEESRFFETLNNECDSKLTDLLQLLGHRIKISFDAGSINADSAIGNILDIRFDSYSNDAIMVTENDSKRVSNVRIQLDDTAISLLTFHDFLNAIYDYINFQIQCLPDRERRNVYKIAVSDAERSRDSESKFDSLSTSQKLEYLSKQFGNAYICPEEEQPSKNSKK